MAVQAIVTVGFITLPVTILWFCLLSLAFMIVSFCRQGYYDNSSNTVTTVAATTFFFTFSVRAAAIVHCTVKIPIVEGPAVVTTILDFPAKSVMILDFPG